MLKNYRFIIGASYRVRQNLKRKKVFGRCSYIAFKLKLVALIKIDIVKSWAKIFEIRPNV
jgi:hypothetical protein